ncbi:hypothetical protein QTN25_010510 [Entamoeba marina]
METQYLYNQNDIKINDIQRFVVCYKVSYSRLIKFEKEDIKFSLIKSNQLIPSFVTSLQDDCFNCCYSVSKIKLPFGLKTIINACFYGCESLKTIEIPQQVSVLKKDCFYDCSTLSTINLPYSLSSFGESCFYGCSKLKGVINVPSYCFDKPS